MKNQKEIKSEFCTEIASLNLKEDDICEVVSNLPNCFAKGYLLAKMTDFENYLPSDSESYRGEILQVASWDIWIV